MDCLHHVAGQLDMLGVHFVIPDAGGPDRPEGVDSDVEREQANLDAGRRQALEERRREVQAGRWGRGRPRLVAVDGLVAFGVAVPALDVAREGRRAE